MARVIDGGFPYKEICGAKAFEVEINEGARLVRRTNFVLKAEPCLRSTTSLVPLFSLLPKAGEDPKSRSLIPTLEHTDVFPFRSSESRLEYRHQNDD